MDLLLNNFSVKPGGLYFLTEDKALLRLYNEEMGNTQLQTSRQAKIEKKQEIFSDEESMSPKGGLNESVSSIRKESVLMVRHRTVFHHNIHLSINPKNIKLNILNKKQNSTEKGTCLLLQDNKREYLQPNKQIRRKSYMSAQETIAPKEKNLIGAVAQICNYIQQEQINSKKVSLVEISESKYLNYKTDRPLSFESDISIDAQSPKRGKFDMLLTCSSKREETEIKLLKQIAYMKNPTFSQAEYLLSTVKKQNPKLLSIDYKKKTSTSGQYNYTQHRQRFNTQTYLAPLILTKSSLQIQADNSNANNSVSKFSLQAKFSIQSQTLRPKARDSMKPIKLTQINSSISSLTNSMIIPKTHSMAQALMSPKKSMQIESCKFLMYTNKPSDTQRFIINSPTKLNTPRKII